MRRIPFLFVLLVAARVHASAPGRTHFLSHGPGSLEESLGGAVAASAIGPNALYYNPAGLARNGGGITGEYVSLLPGVNYSWLGSAFAVGGFGMGLGLASLDLGEIIQRQTILDPGSSAKSYQRAYFLGLSKGLGSRLKLGATFGLLDFRMTSYESKAQFADFGAAYALTDSLTIGGSLKNAWFSGLNFAGNKEVYPQEVRAGFSINRGGAGVFGEVDKTLDGSKPRLAFGLDYAPISVLSLRAGLNGHPRAGIGLASKNRTFAFDFSWSMKALNPTSRISLSYFFREIDERRPDDPYAQLRSRAETLREYLREEAKRLLEENKQEEASAVLKKILALDPSDRATRRTLFSLDQKKYPRFRTFPLAFSKTERAKRSLYLRWAVNFADGSAAEAMKTANEFTGLWPQDRRSDLIQLLQISEVLKIKEENRAK